LQKIAVHDKMIHNEYEHISSLIQLDLLDEG